MKLSKKRAKVHARTIEALLVCTLFFSCSHTFGIAEGEDNQIAHQQEALPAPLNRIKMSVMQHLYNIENNIDQDGPLINDIVEADLSPQMQHRLERRMAAAAHMLNLFPHQ